LWIDRGESTDRAAVVRQNDLIIGLIVHDAVQTALLDFDLLEYCQRLEVEHSDGGVASVGREAVTSLSGDAGPMHTRRVENVAEHPARGTIDHHHVVGPRDEYASGGGFDSYIVGSSVSLDIEFFNLERLRVPDVGR